MAVDWGKAVDRDKVAEQDMTPLLWKIPKFECKGEEDLVDVADLADTEVEEDLGVAVEPPCSCKQEVRLKRVV